LTAAVVDVRLCVEFVWESKTNAHRLNYLGGQNVTTRPPPNGAAPGLMKKSQHLAEHVAN